MNRLVASNSCRGSATATHSAASCSGTDTASCANTSGSSGSSAAASAEANSAERCAVGAASAEERANSIANSRTARGYQAIAFGAHSAGSSSAASANAFSRTSGRREANACAIDHPFAGNSPVSTSASGGAARGHKTNASADHAAGDSAASIDASGAAGRWPCGHAT